MAGIFANKRERNVPDRKINWSLVAAFMARAKEVEAQRKGTDETNGDKAETEPLKDEEIPRQKSPPQANLPVQPTADCGSPEGCEVAVKNTDAGVQPDPEALEKLRQGAANAAAINRTLAVNAIVKAANQARALKSLTDGLIGQSQTPQIPDTQIEGDVKNTAEGEAPIKSDILTETDPAETTTQTTDPAKQEDSEESHSDVTAQNAEPAKVDTRKTSQEATNSRIEIKWNWARKETPNPKPKPAAAVLDPPEEPTETIYSKDSYTLVELRGSRVAMVEEWAARELQSKLPNCSFAFAVHQALRQDKYIGWIVLRGGQWCKKDIAAVLTKLEFDCSSFASLTAMAQSGQNKFSSRFFSAIDYESSRRAKAQRGSR